MRNPKSRETPGLNRNVLRLSGECPRPAERAASGSKTSTDRSDFSNNLPEATNAHSVTRINEATGCADRLANNVTEADSLSQEWI